MIDQNRDGFVDKDDLHDMLASLGKGDLSSTIIMFYFTTRKISLKKILSFFVKMNFMKYEFKIVQILQLNCKF